ncbi:MAG TPA: M13 family metallopeptidase [Chthoniobacteraceae bacterium]
MNVECDPCEDFYNYANGGWLNSNPIPAARSSWSSYDEVNARTRGELVAILAEASAVAKRGEQSEFAKLGTFYTTCMAGDAAAKEGFGKVASDLLQITALTDRAELQNEITRLHLQGVRALFRFTAQADRRDSRTNIALFQQGSLTLPDPASYSAKDPEAVRLREALRAHVARLLSVAGATPAEAAADAARVLEMETALAAASFTPTQMRDPDGTYNPKTLTEAAAIAPAFHFSNYLEAVGAPGAQKINLAQPEYFRTASKLLAEAPMETWRAYLKWRKLSSAAPWLGGAYQREAFKFRSLLTGARAEPPRVEECIDVTNRLMGHALGRVYAERVFTPQSRKRAIEMIANIKAAARERLATLGWGSSALREAALEKLDAMEYYVGAPSRWIDYSSLEVRDEPFIENLQRAAGFELRRQAQLVGRTMDRELWTQLPQTASGVFYDEYNYFLYPAAKFQSPFFDPAADDAVNYGALGATVAHEITHGFDTIGRKFDSQGNLRDWWTPQDATRFDERAQKLVMQFNSYALPDGGRADGALTLSENIADLGGLTFAFHALQKALVGKPRYKIDGFTPEQRFFISWAQNWRANIRPEHLRTMLRTDEHAPPKLRVLGPLSNMPQFAAAFGCKRGDAMVRSEKDRAEIW